MDELSEYSRDLLTKWDVGDPVIRYWSLAFITIVTLSLYQAIKKPKYAAKANAPIAAIPDGWTLAAAKERFRYNARDMLLEGYAKYKGKPFYIPTPYGERLMIPPKYVEELKNAPTDHIDFVATFQEMFEGYYTGFGNRSQLHPKVTRGQLNSFMGEIMPPVVAEVDESWADTVPPCEDWTPVKMADAFTTIVARVSSRMFGGTELSRNEEWIKATLDFAIDGFDAAQHLKKYPAWSYPIAQHFVPELAKLRAHHATSRKVVIPMIRKRKAEIAAGGEKHNDYLQWLMDTAKGSEDNEKFVAFIQLIISFAALHTSSALPAQVLYDLCSHPEYIEPLRQESRQVMEKYKGVLGKKALAELVKMDSFMKETGRFAPFLLITFERIVHRPYTMSDGYQLPGNTIIGSPCVSIFMDPEIYPEPEKFDGYRFLKLREKAADPASAGKLQWAAANPDSMAFGYGRHACPGRFFAANEIKVILVKLLLEYEFKYPEGTTQRPPNIGVETQYMPNHEATILMRKLK